MKSLKFLLSLIFILNLGFEFSATAQVLQPTGISSSEEGTPNLGSSRLWTQTSPNEQVLLGVGELVIGGAMNIFAHDPAVRIASRDYSKKYQKERAAFSELDLTQKAAAQKERELQQLQLARTQAQEGMTHHQAEITAKLQSIQKAKALLTVGPKEARLQEARKRLASFTSEAVIHHRGPIYSHQELIDNLPVVEKSEIERLTLEINQIHDMPDLNESQKKAGVARAETELKEAESARDSAVAQIRDLEKQIAQKSAAIESTRPEIVTAERAWVAERDIASASRTELETVARGKGLKIFGLKVLRYSTDAVVVMELLTRVVVYYGFHDDPGLFPFGRILARVIP